MTPAEATPGGGRDTFPRQYARTRRFTLGQPRAFVIAPDDARVAFLRTAGGSDPVGCLWVVDLPGGVERCVADPRQLGADDEDLPPEERARRERVRESGGGIVAYATDRAVRTAVFALGAHAFVADLDGGTVRPLAVAGPVVDPRPDPLGIRVAYVRDRGLRVTELGGSGEQRLVGDDDPDVTWGLAEFIAAEEMGRERGFWWSPEGTRLAVARVDETSVVRWHLSDPADPATAPVVVAYPAAGTPNAAVSLHVVDLGGHTVRVAWDSDALPYLVDVLWSADGPLTAVVQSRDQRTVQVLAVDPDTGATRVVAEQRQPSWVELVAGVPGWLPGGRLLTTIDDRDTRRLAVDGRPVTPVGLQVRRVVASDNGIVTFTASGADPTAVGVWRVDPDGGEPSSLAGLDGVADAAVAGGVAVTVTRSLDEHGARVRVRHRVGELELASLAETPLLSARVEMLTLGERALRAALLLPADHDPAGGPLPLLLDPYGGPHAQRVVRSADAHLSSQWFADAGFAVLVVDGRGSPGRGPAWERTLAGDLATAPLDDQVDALHALAAARPGLLDLDRVAIRGWSFGGYLAALAVLRRPDVFAAAVAGAPVTDWALYDTHYTERYLGLPDRDPAAYRRSSLLDGAASLDRPLLLIHGLADDNVVVAHTLRLSRALTEAGRPHTVLPLSGVTHMTPQESGAETLLLLHLDFLRRALGAPGPPEPHAAAHAPRTAGFTLVNEPGAPAPARVSAAPRAVATPEGSCHRRLPAGRGAARRGP